MVTATITWTATAGTEGMRLRWDVHEPGSSPSFGTPVDVDASLGSHEITVEWPLGHVLSVGLQGFPEFDSGAADGDPGPETVITKRRPGGPGSPTDSVGTIACRVLFDDNGQLMFDDDHCLLLTDPE